MDQQRMQRINAQINSPTAPLDETSFPTAEDEYGRVMDPTTVIHMGPIDPRPGETSIFSVLGEPSQPRNSTVQDILEDLYAVGFRGRATFGLGGPHPHARARGERVEKAKQYPPTDCQICEAVLASEEKSKGFSLLEFRHAGLAGCSTCSTISKGVEHFAGLIVGQFEGWETFVRQEAIDASQLLGKTSTIGVSVYRDARLATSFKLLARDSTRAPIPWIMDTSSHSMVECAMAWLKTCIHHHDGCLIPSVTALPTRVLDVSDGQVRLYETHGEQGSYLALSHCWGRNPIIKTLKENIGTHRDGIPWSALSKTFQDAASLTWRLGYHYLWIDSLCIVQDDRKDWEVQASQMTQIFSNAQLTIAASRSSEGSGGCFSHRATDPVCIEDGQEKRYIEDPSSIWEPYMITGMDRDGTQKTFAVHTKILHGLSDSPLLRRAWVLQEQVLSPRILHFSTGELYWECKSHVACECTGWEKRTETLQFETRFRKAHAQLANQQLQRELPGGGLELVENAKSFEAYRALVEHYTELEITNDLDRLPALSGIMFGRMQDEYLAGMWRSMLVESFHWMPKLPNQGRLVEPLYWTPKVQSRSWSLAYRPLKYRAPSWSWAAIEAPITHFPNFEPYSIADDIDKITAVVVAASCTPEGSDIRGRVKRGYVTMKGPTIDVTVASLRTPRGRSERGTAWNGYIRIGDKLYDAVASLQDYEHQAGTDTSADITDGIDGGECFLDLPLVLGRTDPAEVGLGDQVTCFQISGLAALVLRSVPDTPGEYTRIGIMSVKR